MRRIALSLSLLVACDAPKEPANPPPSKSAQAKAEAERPKAPAGEDAPEPEPEPGPDPDPEPDMEAKVEGPAANATPEQRRKAVLDLLTDGKTAANLPIRAVDEGKTFDAQLGERMAREHDALSLSAEP